MIEIVLTRGYKTIIDDKDADLAEFKWSAKGHGREVYAHRAPRKNGKSITIFLHRIILERIIGHVIPKGVHVDHIDRNSLNNLRSNLRIATYGQSVCNRDVSGKSTTGYRGVTLAHDKKWYRAQIGYEYKKIMIGTFNTAEDAAIAYNHFAVKLHGEFAVLNDIKNWESIFPTPRIKTYEREPNFDMPMKAQVTTDELEGEGVGQ